MSFSTAFVNERIRVAEQRELKSSDGLLFSDLSQSLTPEVIEEGVTIDFGDDRTSAEAVVDAIGISEQIWRRSNSIHIHNIIVASGSTTSFIGYSIPELGNLPIFDSLAIMQADHWKSYTPHGPYPKIRPEDDKIVSKIVVANSLHTEEGVRAQPGTLGVVLGLDCQYVPYFSSTGSQRPKSLAYAFRDITAGQEGKINCTPIDPLAAEMSVDENLQLGMPRQTYFLKIGGLSLLQCLPATGTIDDVQTEWFYKVRSGRLQLVDA